MSEIFLSASIPIVGRGTFHEDADPFLIQFAVRELLTVVLGRRRIVWGGHPAITPMVWSVSMDMDVDYAKTVVLYQSRFFEEFFPEENGKFANVIYVDAVDNDRAKSLYRMRSEMLKRDYEAAVFIGGMQGVLEEYEMFCDLHPKARAVAVGATGGASKMLAVKLGFATNRIDFARFFTETLQIDPGEARNRDNDQEARQGSST